MLFRSYLSGKKSLFKSIIDLLVSIPIVFPPIALGFVLLLILGKNGFIGKHFYMHGIEIVFSLYGVIIASFIAGLPLVVKPIQSAIDEQTSLYAEASYTLGKGRFATLIHVVLPNIKKVIITALFLGLGRSLGEVGITLMLGGNIVGKTDTLSLAIYNYAFGGEPQKALILSALLGLLSTLIFIYLKGIAYKK